MRGGACGTNALIWVFQHKYCLFENSVKTQELNDFQNSGATHGLSGRPEVRGRSPASGRGLDLHPGLS